jgi:hypothetical protein
MAIAARAIRIIFPELFAFLLLLLADPARAQTAYYWVAKNGSDSFNCATAMPNIPSQTPCLTIQSAINQVPSYVRAIINVGPGVYMEQLNVVGYMHPFIGIFGPYDASGMNCTEPQAVTIDAGGGMAVWAQDHATLQLGCFTIDNAAIGIGGRQYPIVDGGSIVFRNVGQPISMGHVSIFSCGREPLWLTMSGWSFASVDQGRLNIGCEINISPGVDYPAFFNGEGFSRIRTTGMRINGNIAGKKWRLRNSEIGPDCNVPGTGVDQDALSTAPSGC